MKKNANTHVTAQDTRSLIVSAARKIFAKNGYEAASMSLIAKAAHLDKSSLYYFFKNKEDLFAAVTLRIWQELGTVTNGVTHSQPAKSGRRVLSETCQKFIKVSENAGLAMTRMELPQLQASAFPEIMSIIRRIHTEVIAFLKQQGVKDPETAHAIISNAIHAYVLHCSSGKPQPNPKKYCDYLSSLFISLNNK